MCMIRILSIKNPKGCSSQRQYIKGQINNRAQYKDWKVEVLMIVSELRNEAWPPFPPGISQDETLIEISPAIQNKEILYIAKDH